jgi:hypothetical protein
MKEMNSQCNPPVGAMPKTRETTPRQAVLMVEVNFPGISLLDDPRLGEAACFHEN